MNRIGFSVISLALLMSGPAQAQESLRQGLQECASIRNAAERLFCFDSLAAGNSVATPAAATSNSASNNSSARTATSSTPVNRAPATVAAPDRPRESAADTSDFGRELEMTREGPQSVSSRYDGTFNGWTGDTIFRLENGQVWQQAESDRLAYDAERPVITIRRGWFGVYYLKVEGANKQIRVKRIK